jgi:hypothetical protein
VEEFGPPDEADHEDVEEQVKRDEQTEHWPNPIGDGLNIRRCLRLHDRRNQIAVLAKAIDGEVVCPGENHESERQKTPDDPILRCGRTGSKEPDDPERHDEVDTLQRLYRDEPLVVDLQSVLEFHGKPSELGKAGIRPGIICLYESTSCGGPQEE